MPRLICIVQSASSPIVTEFPVSETAHAEQTAAIKTPHSPD